MTEGVDEAALRQPDVLHNLTIELFGDTWASGLRPHLGVLGGLVSAQAEADGWMSSVRPSLSIDHFRVLTNTTLALYFRGVGGYNIGTPERVAIEVPATAVSSGQEPPLVPSFTIAAGAGQAVLSGGVLNASTEVAIGSPQTQQVILSLVGNTWHPLVGNDRWASEAVLSSLVARKAGSTLQEAHGWNAEVRPLLGASSRYLTRLSDTSLMIQRPPLGASNPCMHAPARRPPLSSGAMRTCTCVHAHAQSRNSASIRLARWRPSTSPSPAISSPLART